MQGVAIVAYLSHIKKNIRKEVDILIKSSCYQAHHDRRKILSWISGLEIINGRKLKLNFKFSRPSFIKFLLHYCWTNNRTLNVISFFGLENKLADVAKKKKKKHT